MTGPAKSIDNRYKFLSHIGSGMSGQVVLVEDQGGKKALKFLNQLQLNVSREEALRNFKSEFAVLKKLNHPHIAQIVDFGFDEKSRRYYFTSEYIEGKNLYDACAGQSMEVIEKIFVQVLRAFNYLHACGVYHLDVKPQNILVRMRGGIPEEAKIIDFGLAGLDLKRKMAGTPSYMAPEVIQGGVLDCRTDLYSIGVTFYKVLTDINPFMDKDVRQIFAKQLTLRAPLPSAINRQIPKHWDHILERMLEKSPVERYSQVSLVIRDLAFLSGKKIDVETEDTRISYLPEKGILIGRESQWQIFTKLFGDVFLGEKDCDSNLLIVHGEKGTGKTRFLSEIKHYSQLKGVPVMFLRDHWQRNSDDRSPEKFMLIVDAAFTVNEIHVLLQELTGRILVVWASEAVPPNVSGARSIALGNYSRPELKQYVEAVTGLADIPGKWTDEIFARTQGNPLFVTEFVKKLLSQDELFDFSGKWDAVGSRDLSLDFNQVAIPRSVEEILLQQYEKLDASQKLVLKLLALHGAPLSQDHFNKLELPQMHGADPAGLVEKNILDCRGDSFYFFKNVLFGDVIVKVLPPEETERLHDRLSLIFDQDSHNRKSHLHHVGHGSDHEKAVGALRELARMLMDESDHSRCIATLEKILTFCAGKWDEVWIETVTRLAEVYNLCRQFKDAIVLMKSALSEIEGKRLPVEDRCVFQFYQQLIDCAMKQSHLGETEHYQKMAETYCEVAVQFINDRQLPLFARLVIGNYLAYIKMIHGDIDSAVADYLESHNRWCHELSFEDKLKVVNNRLVDVYLIKQNYLEAIEVCRDRIEVFEASEQHSSLAASYYVLGGVYYKLASTESGINRDELIHKGVHNFKKCEEIANRIHHDNLLLCTINGLGNAYLLRQESNQALKYYFRALKIARKISELETAGLVAFNISNIYKNQHQMRDSYSFLVYAVNTFQSLPRLNPNSHIILLWSYLSLCDHFLQKNDTVRAGEHLDLARQIYLHRDYLQSQKYWLVMREALFAKVKGEMDMWDELLSQARLLAQTQEQRDDLQQCLDWDIIKNAAKMMGRNVATQPVYQQNSADQHDLKEAVELGHKLLSCQDKLEVLKLAASAMASVCGARKGICLMCRPDDSFAVRPLLNFSHSDESLIDLDMTRRSVRDLNIYYGLKEHHSSAVQVIAVPIADDRSAFGVLYLVRNEQADLKTDILMLMAGQVLLALSRFERAKTGPAKST